MIERVKLELHPGRPSDYLRWLMMQDELTPEARWLMSLGLASKSDYLENKNLDHNNGKTAFTMPTTVYLALCTTVPTDASTGTSIVEANYTTYARKQIVAGEFNAASAGSQTTNAVETFAACTAGSSTIIGWATVDALTVGNMLYWGTATSTVISTTQTPPTVASGGLVVNED